MLPVVIIGGGPVGLVSSILLSLQQIQHVLCERHPSTSIHPKACGLNQRTIEIFRHIGIEDEVLRQAAPANTHCRTSWFTSLGPDGREIHSRDAWGGGKYRPLFEKASPSPYAILPQIRLEPILQRRARELNPDGLKYSSEVLSIEEKSDRVIVKVRGPDGVTYETEAQYALGADGGRMVTDWLGIPWEGEHDIFDMVSAYFKTPLSLHHPEPRSFISWFINPATGGSIKSGYLYHLGPYPQTPETEEWYFGCAMLPDDPERFDTASMIQRILETLKIPDLDINLLSTSHWMVASIVAQRFRSSHGRVFLVGDAAHRIPPWGALGVNTGVQDAFNLVWKLAFAIRGDHSDVEALLDSYDAERRPIAQRVARSSLFNLKSHAGAMDKALGLSVDQTHAENSAALDIALDPTHEGYPQKQELIAQAQAVLDSEFGAHGTEVGWFYLSADTKGEGQQTNHDGQIKPDGTFDELTYHPSTIPGHRLPHAWLQRGGKTVSTRDLIDPAKFVLFTRTAHLWDWIQGSRVKVEVIDAEHGWTDRDGAWDEVCNSSKQGAVLVRPDGIVAWRGEDRDSTLSALLTQLVGAAEHPGSYRNS
ncbi:FAD binding domain-containing protein [Aspergillus unguis]